MEMLFEMFSTGLIGLMVGGDRHALYRGAVTMPEVVATYTTHKAAQEHAAYLNLTRNQTSCTLRAHRRPPSVVRVTSAAISTGVKP